MSDEIPLAGGHLSTVVRVGDTVRRGTGPWTPAVHALLAHLEARGFAGAPRPRGLDDRGREVLSYLPGETVGATRPWPAWTRDGDLLRQVGSWLRAYHQTVADFVPPEGSRWRFSDASVGAGRVVCHADVAPYNAVVEGGRLVGFIDWDVAGPADPLEDVAFAAWNWVPLFDDAHASGLGWLEPPDRPARLRAFAEAYRLPLPERLVDATIARMQASLDRIEGAAASGEAAFQRLVADGHLEPVRRAQQLVRRERESLLEALGA